MIDKERLLSNLLTSSAQHRVEVFDIVDSTNTIAKGLLSQGAGHGTLVVAEAQTHGRGRLGRAWHSPKGGLYFSLVLLPSSEVVSLPLYGLMVACVIREVIHKKSGLECMLKWPNDLLVSNRKVCGILSELVTDDERIKGLVVGAGINVNTLPNMFPEEIRSHATSLRIETGKEHNLEEFLAAIVVALESWLVECPSLSNVVSVYRTHCLTLGKQVVARIHGTELVGIAFDIERDGSLLIRDDAGRTHRVNSGEVTHLRGCD